MKDDFKIKVALRQFLQEKHSGHFQLKALLFDMDGVLFDSMKNHTLAWYRTISALGIACTRDEFYLYEGCTGAGTINLLFNRTYGRNATEEEINRIYAEKSRYFNELPEAGPMSSVGKLLERVVSRGITPVLVTGSGQRSLLDRLDGVFPGVFKPELMVTALDVKYGKPHPEPYLKGLEKAGVTMSEAMVIENAPMGVKSAVAAGLFTLAVNTGPIPENDLIEAGANVLFPDMQSILAHFDEIETLC